MPNGLPKETVFRQNFGENFASHLVCDFYDDGHLPCAFYDFEERAVRCGESVFDNLQNCTCPRPDKDQ